MKIRILFYILFFIPPLLKSQESYIDSLRSVIALNKQDTAEVNALFHAVNYFAQKNLDSMVDYTERGLQLSHQINYQFGEADFVLYKGWTAFNEGNYAQALDYLLKALRFYEEIKNEDGIVAAHGYLQAVYRTAGDYRKSLEHAFIELKMVEPTNMIGKRAFPGLAATPLILAEIGGTYEEMGELDSALFYTKRAIDKKLIVNGANWCYPYQVYGKVLTKQKKFVQALEYYRTAIPLATKNGYFKDTLDIYNDIATLYRISGQLDSSVWYAASIIRQKENVPDIAIVLKSSSILAEVYKLKGNNDSALQYLELSTIIRDRIFSQKKQMEFQNQALNEVLRKQELIQEKEKYQSTIRSYLLLAGLITAAVIAFLLYRTVQNRKKAYQVLEEQKKQTDEQRKKAEQALRLLQSTQAHLIQSEKMASLGELTAGIAHEIQNPLNFVNNFSEVNKELLTELKNEIEKGNLDEVKSIANDVIDNEEKISHHGKRADSIVKGMLQHSRITSGQKEPTDINALADEYLRLSYHGMRAKDKSFNAALQTNFDQSIGKINVIPQEIGRVLINLYNNAFQSMMERVKMKRAVYDPIISVTTRKQDNKVTITVRDNGVGIPEKIKDKIFQPFFTTKPAGSGTGLGLSLSYDIITKEHGGEITVNSKEGEGAEFVVSLPV